ncbi:MAG: type II toxin-antitoxin system PemK/MazF family toxin [Deltaproteobacteria bacterium]|nr:type II toxin-antitoxin system PemK/MazF family toxin [Deltaproteobacteria bacterium]
MPKPGQIVVFAFPQTNLLNTKLRPALLIQRLPGKYDDWLTCMISSKTNQAIPGFDDIINEVDNDYANSGLKTSSVFRVGRLAVQEQNIFLGSIGEISDSRLQRISENISSWIYPKT